MKQAKRYKRSIREGWRRHWIACINGRVPIKPETVALARSMCNMIQSMDALGQIAYGHIKAVNASRARI